MRLSGAEIASIVMILICMAMSNAIRQKHMIRIGIVLTGSGMNMLNRQQSQQQTGTALNASNSNEVRT